MVTRDGAVPDRGGELLDAAAFLDLTARLRESHRRVEAADLPELRRAPWQQRLVAITDLATRDLVAAEVRLRRLERDLDRQLEG